MNTEFIQKGNVKDGKLLINDLELKALFIIAQYLDMAILETLMKLATKGLPIILKRIPAQAGYRADERFNEVLDHLLHVPNVYQDLSLAPISPPLVEGEALPDFWARVGEDG